MTEEKRKEFEKLCKPLMEWIETLPHPHFTIIVSANHSEILEGQATTVLHQNID